MSFFYSCYISSTQYKLSKYLALAVCNHDKCLYVHILAHLIADTRAPPSWLNIHYTHTNSYIKIILLLFCSKYWVAPCTLCDSFYINRQDEGQRLCIILVWGPEFLTWQFAVFSFGWVVTIDLCRLIQVPVYCSVKAAWLFALRVNAGIWKTTTDGR